MQFRIQLFIAGEIARMGVAFRASGILTIFAALATCQLAISASAGASLDGASCLRVG